MTYHALEPRDETRHNAGRAMDAEYDPYYNVLSRATHTPQDFKVCTVCGNIVELDLTECLYCGAYRFNDSPEFVSDTALNQLTTPRHAVTDPIEFAAD